MGAGPNREIHRHKPCLKRRSSPSHTLAGAAFNPKIIDAPEPVQTSIKEVKVGKRQDLTPRRKLPRGHQPRRYSLVMRDKRQRRFKDRLRRELEG